MSSSLLGMALMLASLGNPDAMRCRVGALHVDYNPERVWPVEDVRRSVREASAVVRTVATRFDARPLRPGSEPGWGTVYFRVLETINGTVPTELAFEGRAVTQDDFNGASVPYRFVRRAGTYGDCFAREYRIGGEYLFFLKDEAGVLTPHWWALGPTNEQVSGAGDPWVVWVRAAVASPAGPQPDGVPFTLASPRLLMFHGGARDAVRHVVKGDYRGLLQGRFPGTLEEKLRLVAALDERIARARLTERHALIRGAFLGAGTFAVMGAWPNPLDPIVFELFRFGSCAVLLGSEFLVRRLGRRRLEQRQEMLMER